MKNPFRQRPRYISGLLVAAVALFAFHAPENGQFFGSASALAKITPDTVVSEKVDAALDQANPRIQAVMAVQHRHTPDLMAIAEVVGTGTGLTDEGRPAVFVFATKKVPAGIIPDSLEGVPVAVKVTGAFIAMIGPPPGKGPGSGGGGGSSTDGTARFGDSVPIGVSTGNANECAAGTIGARVKDGQGVYALSNNHVYARENAAQLGEEVDQPGVYDTSCFYDSANALGTLAAFKTIVFSTSASNTIDAAIALVNGSRTLGNSTPADGYGTPKSATAVAAIGQAVQKYGRTTGLTKGAVEAIDATIDVTYSGGTARFVNQIVVTAGKPFIKPGDSGSLLVTDPDRNPVGLLFAGSNSGKYAIANPIQPVLTGLGVTIDGE